MNIRVPSARHQLLTRSVWTVQRMSALAVKWVPYNKQHVSNYLRVHYSPASDLMVLQVNTAENTFVQVTQTQFNIDMLRLCLASWRQ